MTSTDEAVHQLSREIEDALRKFLHPLAGGRDGVGWPFGRSVLKTDLIHLVEEVPGVEGVDSIEISTRSAGSTSYSKNAVSVFVVVLAKSLYAAPKSMLEAATSAPLT